MKTYHLPATESDLQLLAELLREARQQPFQFAYPDREERVIELEKKWINPTREALFPPAIAERVSIFFDVKERNIEPICVEMNQDL